LRETLSPLLLTTKIQTHAALTQGTQSLVTLMRAMAGIHFLTPPDEDGLIEQESKHPCHSFHEMTMGEVSFFMVCGVLRQLAALQIYCFEVATMEHSFTPGQ
jgi:hypothetical protein